MAAMRRGDVSLMRINAYHGLYILPVMLVLLVFASSAQASISRADKIKAGFLLHFSTYVSWPEQPDLNRITVCIFGTDPFVDFINQMAGQRTLSQTDKKLHITRIISNQDLTNCQIAYFSNRDNNYPAIKQLREGHGVLLVGENEAFLQQGGIARFKQDKNRIRIEFNLNQALTSNLLISAELLRVVSIITLPEGQ